MPIEVEMPDGSIAEFPDGFGTENIKNVIADMTKAGNQPWRNNETSAQPAVSGAGRFASPQAKDARAPPGAVEDFVKSAGSGLVRGAVGLATLPGNIAGLWEAGWRKAGGALGVDMDAVNKAVAEARRQAPHTQLPTSADAEQAIAEKFGPLHDPQTTAGRYAHAIGQFAPGAAFPGGLAQRAIGNVAAPAIVSETAGEATKGTAMEPVARIVGAVAGGQLPRVAARTYTPAPSNPVRQQHVAALQAEGVTDLTAGQMTGSKPLRWLESAVQDIPGTGGRGATMMERQAEQFTAAALRRAGINANRATPDVIDDAFTTIGQRFDTLANASTARMSVADANRMGTVMRNYERVTPPRDQTPAVREYLNNIVTHAGNPIPGPVYARYRSAIEADARALQPRDPLGAQTLRDIRGILDDAVERGMPQAQRGQWREVRNHYRNMLVLERAAGSAGEAAAEGLISPSALRNATKTLHGQRNYVRGNGDFAELARAGENIMKPLPQSGTAPRAAATGIIQAVGAGGGAMAGGAPGAALGALASPLATAAAGRMFMSPAFQRYLANQRFANPPPPNLGGVSAMPGLLGAAASNAYPPGDPRNN